MATWQVDDAIEFIGMQSDVLPNWEPVFKEQIIALKRSGSIICPQGIQHYKLDLQIIITAIAHENLKALAEQQAQITLSSEGQARDCQILVYHATPWQTRSHFLGNISFAAL